MNYLNIILLFFLISCGRDNDSVPNDHSASSTKIEFPNDHRFDKMIDLELQNRERILDFYPVNERATLFLSYDFEKNKSNIFKIVDGTKKRLKVSKKNKKNIISISNIVNDVFYVVAEEKNELSISKVNFETLSSENKYIKLNNKLILSFNDGAVNATIRQLSDGSSVLNINDQRELKLVHLDKDMNIRLNKILIPADLEKYTFRYRVPRNILLRENEVATAFELNSKERDKLRESGHVMSESNSGYYFAISNLTTNHTYYLPLNIKDNLKFIMDDFCLNGDVLTITGRGNDQLAIVASFNVNLNERKADLVKMEKFKISKAKFYMQNIIMDNEGIMYLAGRSNYRQASTGSVVSGANLFFLSIDATFSPIKLYEFGSKTNDFIDTKLENNIFHMTITTNVPLTHDNINHSRLKSYYLKSEMHQWR